MIERIINEALCRHRIIPLSDLIEIFNEHLWRGETLCTDLDDFGNTMYCRSIFTYLEALAVKGIVKIERGWVKLLNDSICRERKSGSKQLTLCISIEQRLGLKELRRTVTQQCIDIDEEVLDEAVRKLVGDVPASYTVFEALVLKIIKSLILALTNEDSARRINQANETKQIIRK